MHVDSMQLDSIHVDGMQVDGMHVGSMHVDGMQDELIVCTWKYAC